MKAPRGAWNNVDLLTQWISERSRGVPYVAVQVHIPRVESDGVVAHPAAEDEVDVAGAVVAQAGVGVVFSAGEAPAVGAGAGFGDLGAESVVAGVVDAGA